MCRHLTQTCARKVAMCDRVRRTPAATAEVDRALAHGMRKSCPVRPVHVANRLDVARASE
ncbi:hypothetical protein XANMN_13725 [Xanthomonas phaseoli pv. manihotis str. CIO151]|nr:hypothetical protein XANMN_13725 [Xanthomonas phaseoli pv. manihotis str. CIO151]